MTRYRLDFGFERKNEPMDDPLNDPIKQTVLRIVQTVPGLNLEQIVAAKKTSFWIWYNRRQKAC